MIMVSRRHNSNLCLFTGIFALVLAVTVFLSGTALPDEGITVTCYKNDVQVGSVIVFDPAAAAGACNAQYHDCRGLCVGCFYDFDYYQDVCVDNYGNTFLR